MLFIHETAVKGLVHWILLEELRHFLRQNFFNFLNLVGVDVLLAHSKIKDIGRGLETFPQKLDITGLDLAQAQKIRYNSKSCT